MASPLDHIRASRYRWLALAEPDQAVADLLNKLAREAELGILFTPDRGRRSSMQHRLQSGNRSRDPAKANRYGETSFPW